MRLIFLLIALVAMVLIPFFIWGDALMAFFTWEHSLEWLRGYGDWAWAIAIVLLIGDLFLPLPATIIMSALGYIYGPLVGGLISAAGSFASGVLAYWLCRMVGDGAAIWLLGQKEYERGKKISTQVGGWVVALSRWLPVFPEVIACMAGLTRMPVMNFYVALVCGSLPLGFTYAIVGNSGVTNPVLAIGLSAGLPPLIWFGVNKIIRTRLKEGINNGVRPSD
jgi:uncharacterized membrane protein YdjX (TVP38/TMEM64 family)